MASTLNRMVDGHLSLRTEACMAAFVDAVCRSLSPIRV